MANLHKLTVQEALNAQGVGGSWTVNAAGTAGAQDTVTDTIHLDISGAHQLGVYAEGSIYFNFSSTTTDCNISNDLILRGTALTFFTVPQQLGSTIYFNYLSTSDTKTPKVRTVEV